MLAEEGCVVCGATIGEAGEGLMVEGVFVAHREDRALGRYALVIMLLQIGVVLMCHLFQKLFQAIPEHRVSFAGASLPIGEYRAIEPL
jgi:hypothetical protein